MLIWQVMNHEQTTASSRTAGEILWEPGLMVGRAHRWIVDCATDWADVSARPISGPALRSVRFIRLDRTGPAWPIGYLRH